MQKQIKENLETNILQDLGLANLSLNKKVALVDKMTDLIEHRVLARSIKKLSKEDQKKLAELTNAGPSKEKDLQKFYEEKIGDTGDIIIDEILKLKEELKGQKDKILKEL
ncbi:MAG: hypothetical protein ACD_63C00049G0002 [uncultured bacterium]|nr:MAG: hypothetical protein ACD_63C00049G0002 [uncultured bacterium]